MKDEAVCRHVTTLSPRVRGYGKSWVKKLLRGRYCEHSKTGHLFPDRFDLWYCLGSCEENLAFSLLYEGLLTVGRVSRRRE